MSDFFEDAQETTADQSQPHSKDAELAVIGAVLINQEAYYEVSQFLRADDFYIYRHRFIWEAFDTLHERRAALDLVTLQEELEQQGHLNEIGGPAFLAGLSSFTPSYLHATEYGRIVEQNAIRRRMLQAANEVARLAHKPDVSVDEVLDGAEKAIFGVSERRLTHEIKPINIVLKSYFEHVADIAKRPNDLVGVPTGFYDLDKLLSGLQPSDLLIIAGRPGQGKTGFLLSIAKNAAQLNHKKVAIFSLEMSNEQLVQRLVAQETGIDSQRLRTGKLNPDEWPIFIQAVDTLSRTPIFLDDTPAITPNQLRTKCRRLYMEHGIDLIIVDYLQLMSGGVRTDNRVQEVSHISRSLKNLARDINVPILAAAQLSRAIEQRSDKRPMLSDLRESGSLEQDADIVMFIHRPDLAENDATRPAVAEIRVEKHRNGPTGIVELIFRSSLARFENAVTRNVDLKDLV